MTRFSICAIVAGFLFSALAEAHGMRTGYLEIAEIQPGHATVHLRLNAPDPTVGIAADPYCGLENAGDATSVFERSWVLECAGGLTGRALQLQGLGPIVSEVVV
jgi:hypothetical protein